MLGAGGNEVSDPPAVCEFSSQTLRSDRRVAQVAPASARASGRLLPLPESQEKVDAARGCPCPGAGVARAPIRRRRIGRRSHWMAERSQHRASEGLEGRRERPATGMGSPEPNANWEGTQVENLCYRGKAHRLTTCATRETHRLKSCATRGCEGLPVPGSRRCSGTDPPQADWSAQPLDGGAKSASSERRPGRPKGASGDGHGQPRAHCELGRHTG